MADGTARAAVPLAALRLAAALDGRTASGHAGMDSAVTAGEQLAAALGYLRSLTALAARFDRPAADKITATLTQAARDAAASMERLTRDRIRELSGPEETAMPLSIVPRTEEGIPA